MSKSEKAIADQIRKKEEGENEIRNPLKRSIKL